MKNYSRVTNQIDDIQFMTECLWAPNIIHVQEFLEYQGYKYICIYNMWRYAFKFYSYGAGMREPSSGYKFSIKQRRKLEW